MKSFLWCRDWILLWFRLRPQYRVRRIEGDLPPSLNKYTIYIVGQDGYSEHISMLCPCGCADVVHLNLLPDERPVWKIENHSAGTITLHPSIWRKVGCKSHYWIRQGQVEWFGNKPAGNRSL